MTTGKIVKLLDANKAKAAFLAPLITAVAAALASWIVTGDFNDTEIRTAAGGAVLSLASALATYVTPAGEATVDARIPAGSGDRTPGILSERGYSVVEILAACLLAALLVFVVLAIVN